MRELRCLISIGVKPVARELRTIAAKTDSSFLEACEGTAWLGHIEEGDCPVCVSAPLTYCLFRGNMHPFGNQGSQFFVLVRQVQWAVKAIQTTGRCHLLVIHGRLRYCSAIRVIASILFAR